MKSLRDVIQLDRRMLVFDLETTHVNPKIARIVELGLEIMEPDKPTKEYRTYVNPGIPIPPDSTEIHHITDEMVKDAPTFQQLAPNLIKGFSGADFCGYNVRFDLRIITAEFKRYGYAFEYEDARVLDAFRIWQVVDGRSLDDAWEHWVRNRYLEEDIRASIGEDGKSHTALWDVKRASRVMVGQIEAVPETLPPDLKKLHDICWPGWYDSEGKLKWRGRDLCIAFGEHRETSLREVPRGYLTWILKKDFSDKVKDACRKALAGEYLEPPADLVADEDPDDE